MVAKLKVDQLETVDGTGIITANNPLAGDGASLTGLNATNLGSGTVPTARLGTGTADADNFLRGDGAWEPAGGGKVLQVVSSQINGTTSSTSNVYTHIFLSITPTLASSKVLVTVTFGMGNNTNGSGNSQAAMELKRGGTSGTIVIERTVISGNNTDSNREGMQRATMQVLDSPSTTSSTEYGLYLKNTDGALYYVGAWGYSIGWLSPACVTLMEIGA